MSEQHIGIQKVAIHNGDVSNHIRVEAFESSGVSRLFINDIVVDRVYPTPGEAYEDAVRLLKLKGESVELEIDVAINVMKVKDVEQAISNAGVDVVKITET